MSTTAIEPDLGITRELSAPRVVGYDVARALAIFGMVVVHFTLVMSGHTYSAAAARPRWVGAVLHFLDGRAAAAFVVLAGIGVTLGSCGVVAGGEVAAVRAARVRLVRRGLFLL